MDQIGELRSELQAIDREIAEAGSKARDAADRLDILEVEYWDSIRHALAVKSAKLLTRIIRLQREAWIERRRRLAVDQAGKVRE